MTTKKQKRALMAEKRAKYDEETRQLGLAAQKLDREKRQRRAEQVQREKSLRSKKLAEQASSGGSGLEGLVPPTEPELDHNEQVLREFDLTRVTN